MATTGDNNFAIENALLWKLFADRIEHLGEVAVERFLVTALKEYFIAVSKDEDTEAVPLGLIYPLALGWNLLDSLGEHRKDWRIDDELHVFRRLQPQGCGCDEVSVLLSI